VCSIALVRCGQDTYLGVGAAAGDGVAAVAVAVAVGGLGRHFCLGVGWLDLAGLVVELVGVWCLVFLE
jgi:hypothetical protein